MNPAERGHIEGAAMRCVVVGSGFGGAVAAARLSQAGFDVTVVERGRRWEPGSFPRDESDLNNRWLWEKDRGLYDLRWLDSMISVQAAGWGGGSLVYANVFARAPGDAFDQGWPASYNRRELDPYYDLAAHMLEVRQVSRNPYTTALPTRTQSMDALVSKLGRSAGTVHPHLAVQFAPPGTPVVNRHGQPQFGCTFVGECVLGCNVGAKNSLDHNYLALAEKHGATSLTDTEVRAIRDSGSGFVLSVRDLESEREWEISADSVFVAAGAIGSFELLMRSRGLAHGLPRLSSTLGTNFSGNGDYLAFIKRRGVSVDADEGPTITTTTIVDFDLNKNRVWFQVQDGGYPRALLNLVAHLDPTRATRTAVSRGLARAIARLKIDLTDRASARGHIMTLLLMGRDSSDGRLSLDHHGEARVTWNNRKNARLYRAEGQVARLVAKALGGSMTASPAWRYLRKGVTVHNLGGVPMGVDIAHGVVDDAGEVHGYPGLFVIDGSTVPTATGVNPSATITAMAERNIEAVIRRHLRDPLWRAPEWRHVQPGTVPEDEAMRAMNRSRIERSGHGVVFHEKIKGRLCATGDDEGAQLELTLELECRINGWRVFLQDPLRKVTVTGSADVQGLRAPAAVTGTIQLFAPDNDEAMQYELRLVAEDGRTWSLNAVKAQQAGRPWRMLHDLTTLDSRLTGSTSPEPLAGTLAISASDVVRLACSVRGSAFSRPQRLAAVGRFLAYFARQAARGVYGRDQ
ncbi:GMC family oxidoreductase [Nesterenkonia sp. E16_7]|uniref:GMC oxidoreductase n=1 Tax=unclassified Nesterenkonia TaxID=2629769 RepID=UPI001A91FC7A|nr:MULTISPECIES: GMC family oxidoreductase [unclassified Nesterenkonia]MBO0595904.1 GMC family oxidoreductase [Nesterenkonia sp. E16_10]MBO0599497.1 GMC family oxidoreductase [Nesterenkonia sp. E16_7]